MKNTIALILACFMAYPVLGAAQAAPDPPDELRTFSGTWGRMEAGFIPDATRIVVGEPLFVDFVVRNTGDRPVVFRMGGDDRGSVRHNRFMIVARIADGDGTPLPDPHAYLHGGGAVTIERLGPGETYRQPLLLQHWVSLADPLGPLPARTFTDKDGQPQQPRSWQVSVTAAHTLAIMEPDQRDARASHYVPVTDGFLLTVVPGDTAALGAVVERFRRQCEGKDQHLRRKALIALGVIEHPAAVDVLLDQLHQAAGDGCSETIEGVLPVLENLLSDKRVAPALIRYVCDPKHVGRSSSCRVDACRLLANCDHPAVAETLLHLASTEGGAMRTQAIWGLRHVDKKRAVEVLYRLLKQTEPTDLARAPIATVLCEHGEPFDRSWVMELIRSWPGQHQTYSDAITAIARHGDLADARALAGCLRDDSNTQVSAFNARIIQAIQQLGGPKHPYKWLDKNRINDANLRKQNQDTIEAYRAWARKASPQTTGRRRQESEQTERQERTRR